MRTNVCVLLLTAGLLWGCSEEPKEQAASTAPEKTTVAVESDSSGKTAAVEAVADKQTKLPPRLPKVLDRFEVGQNVYVRALKVEHEANGIWVGTSAGVHEISLQDNSVRQTFTREEGLANEYVFAVGIDHKGNKWFGTNSGGVSRYKDGDWKTFFPMHGLADYWVYAFDSQKDGTLWIGTWAGANKVDPKTGEFTTYIRELVNEWVYGLAVDSQDRVWFGTEGGISRFDGSQWVSWTHADGLGAANSEGRPPSKNTGLGTRERHDLGVLSGGVATYNPSYVFSVLIDRNDTLWAGTWGAGLSHFADDRWRNYTTKDGLAGDIVYSLAEDENGVLWIGTNRGLSRFDGANWHNYGRHEGFANLDVYALAIADNGDIWAGTKGTVLRLGLDNAGEK